MIAPTRETSSPGRLKLPWLIVEVPKSGATKSPARRAPTIPTTTFRMMPCWASVRMTMLARSVAIKAIRADLAAEPQIVERFRSEAKILARVHHPAIATIYSFFRDGGELYLAMEFVRGRSLARVLTEEGALAWPRAVAL